MQPQIRIKRTEWQKEVWDCDSRFKVINCGRRSGKSTISAVKMIYFATQKQSQQVWYLAPNYKQAKQIMWAMLRDLVPKEIIKSKNEVELKIELTNNSTIFLKGTEDPDTLRGTRIDLAIFDEVAFMNRWDEIWKVLRPTLVDSKAEVWFVSTPNGFNHFYDLYNSNDERYKSFHFTSYDNPHLDKEELDQIKQEMSEDAFAQEFLGEFRKMTGLIYKEFDRKIHMVDIPTYIDTNWSFTRSLDFGFAHKTALVYFAISPTGKEIYAYDGIYLDSLTVPDIAEIARTKDGGRVITNPVADSAQPAMIEELNRLGVRFSPVEKGPDSVKNGIAKVAELLKVRADTGKPTLMFNKDLDWIAREFEAYKWVENKSADNAIKEVPYKVNDDAVDAIRYMVMSYKGNQTPLNPNQNWRQTVQEKW